MTTRICTVLATLTCACAANPGAIGDDKADDMGQREYVPEQGVKTVTANGIDFAYFEDGEGPLVLLIHGFPDTPHTFDQTRARLAAAGYRAVSPFTRGYAPTEIPSGDPYDAGTLGADVIALIDALGEDHAILIGHDWGATAVYAAAATHPEKVDKLVAIAIPHPVGSASEPNFFERAPHFLTLSQPDAEAAMRANDFAGVNELYKRWSPGWSPDAAELEPVKNAFTYPGSLAGALGYYRALIAGGTTPPAFVTLPISVPTLAVSGGEDPIFDAAMFDRAAPVFTAGYRVMRSQGGHFPHREYPEPFLTELLSFLAGTGY